MRRTDTGGCVVTGEDEQPTEPQQWVPERDEPAAVFGVHKVALREIDSIVGNEEHLGSDECAQIRAILTAALSGDSRPRVEP